MPSYSYTAYTPTRQRMSGQLTAASPTDAASRLTAQQLTVVLLTETSGTTTPATNRPLSLDEKVYFTQNLATFLRSGIPIAEALTTTANDSPSSRLRTLLHQVAYDVRGGRSLAESLFAFPNTFDAALVALIEAGEESGKLDVIFGTLTAKFRQESQTIARVRGALVYPAIVVLSLGLLGTILIFFVLPRIATVFERFAVDLPAVTELLIRFSHLMNANRVLGLGSLLLGFGTLGVVASLPATRRALVGAASRLPGFRRIIEYLDFERFTSTLAILLKAGVPIQRSLEVAGRVVSRPTFAREIPIAAKQVSEGKRLAEALEGTSLPRMALSLIAAGERSGTLAENLESLEVYYHDHLDESLRTFTALIEPVLTLVVGLAIGAIAIAIIAPIYQLIGQLNVGGGQ